MAERVHISLECYHDGNVGLGAEDMAAVGESIKRILDLSEAPDEKVILAMLLLMGKLFITRMREGYGGVQFDQLSFRKNYEYFVKFVRTLGQ